jgi:glycosyltransferase involved in cell wall biosynthesis
MSTAAKSDLRVAMMIETDGPGGAEVMLVQLSEELRRRGHVVTPVGPQRGIGWLSGRLRNLGFDRRTFTLRRALDPQCAIGLVRLLRELRADVVHSHEFTMAVYGSLAARWLGIPHVITMHGNERVLSAWRRRAALRLAARMSRALIAVSQHTRVAMLSALGLPEAAIQVIPNGVPRRPGDREGTRRKLGFEDDEVMVLSVGNLRPRKGHAVLVEAFGWLRREGCAAPWQLVIAGDGPEREPLARLAQKLEIADRVHLLGHRDDIPDLQAATDVYAMPSFAEGMPLAMLEAMIVSKPVVASQVGGLPEMVRDQESGLLVPAGDAGALAIALRSLIEDPEKRARIGAAGGRHAASEYHIGVMADRYERLYRGRTGDPEAG